MTQNTIVPPGVSGRAPIFDNSRVTLETVTNELALLNLGNFEPLNIKIDCGKFMQEIGQFNDDWVDYLPRTDRPNNRKGLTITSLPGKTHRDNPSLAQASHAAGRRLSENDFNQPTDVFRACSSLHELLNEFSPLGRTFLVKSNTGGYFVPHRDHPSMPRESFRLAVFLHNCGPLQYDWIIDTDKKLQIEHGRVYYINTRMTHRTISWVNDSIHLILNVPFNSQNVAKVLTHLQHSH
jgi:hypothetical protein